MTAEVEKISYASVLVEVDIIQELPEELYLEKVDGLILVQEIEYELKPQVCKACHQMVHDQDECKKGKEKPQQAPSPQKQKGNINIRRPWRPKWLLKEAQAKASTSAPTPDMGKMEKQLANIQVENNNHFPVLSASQNKRRRKSLNQLVHIRMQISR